MRISICIPHYNRAQYLLVVLESIRCQTYPDIEVIISDDCSTDDSASVIPAYIARVEANSHVTFRYVRREKNGGYDINLRTALELATGEYLFILGNDDALATDHTAADIASLLDTLGKPDVAFGNYCLYGDRSHIDRRALSTAVIGKGPSVAIKAFRSFSFVAGIIFRRDAFEAHNTSKHDGTVYVQMYLGARIIAAGGVLATIDVPLVAKDVVVGGVDTTSYRDTLKRDNSKLMKKAGGLNAVAGVICDAILPCVALNQQRMHAVSIYQQILTKTYAHWLHQYRKDGVYRASVNLALGCAPRELMRFGYRDAITYLRILPIYLVVTSIGVLAPMWLLEMAKARLYTRSKRLL